MMWLVREPMRYYREKWGRYWAVTPSDDRELPGGENIKIPEQFVSTRKNLLWFSAILILITLARIEGLDGDKIEFMLIKAELPVSHLIVLILAASLPTAFNFWFFGKQMTMAHSKGLHRGEFRTIEAALAATAQRFRDWDKYVGSAQESLGYIPSQERERLGQTIKKSSDIVAGDLSQHESLIEQVMGFIKLDQLPHEPSDFKRFHQKLEDRLNKAKYQASCLAEENNSLASKVVQHIDKSRLSADRIWENEIDKVTREITQLSVDFSALDASLNGSDRFKFRFIEIGVTRVVYSTALLLSVCGMFQSARTWLHQLLF